MLLALLALVTALSVSGQSTCIQYRGIACKGILKDFVYISDETTVEELEITAATYAQQLLGLSFVSPQCYQAQMTLMCTSIFAHCNESDSPPTAIYPCRSSCEQTNQLCQPLFQNYANLERNCTGFPASDENSSAPNSAGCYDSSSLQASLPECPIPNMLSRVDKMGPCYPSCGSDYYTKSQEQAVSTTAVVSAWFSLIGTFFVIVTWTIFPFKRTFPSVMIRNIAIASFMCAIGLLLNMVETDGFPCKDKHTPADDSNGLCMLQGILLHMFPLSIASWWLCVAVNLHQMIYFKNKRTEALYKYYLAFAWGIPVLLVIIALAADSYHYDQMGFRFCTIKTVSYFDGLFNSWFIIIGILGFGLMFHVTFDLYKSYKQVQGVPNASRNIIRAQARSVIFLLYYYCIVMPYISLIYIARDNKDEGISELQEYFECVFMSPDPYNPDSSCDYAKVIPYSAFFFSTITVYGQGFFLFITFMTTRDTYECWRTLLVHRSVDYNPISSEGRNGGTKSMADTSKLGGDANPEKLTKSTAKSDPNACSSIELNDL
eukprot:TRINITY_DN9698_c0_g1_i3.p1 TRINITY_DN9698_c0_g1~~TRINITY_DN9698_c0_g1_i3.p1  ORF type:complete len:546 (+),score=86.68 TRINITY_DN9698_c0_g1_i3:570-2207(+)